MKLWRCTQNRFLTVFMSAGCFFHFTLCGFEQMAEDLELRMQKGIYLQEIKDESEQALVLFESIVEQSPSGDYLSQALYRIMVCELRMHRDDLARIAFRQLQTRFSEDNKWVQFAYSRVPGSFLKIDIPWDNGEQNIFQWINKEGRTIGYAGIWVYKIEEQGKHFWRLESRMVGHGYRHYRIDFEVDTMLPTYSYYRLRHSDSLEDDLLGFGFSEDDSIQDNAWDHESIGFLLRQFPLELGYSSNSNLFKVSEGMRIPVEIEVTSLENINFQKGASLARFEVSLNLQGKLQKFWFENDAKRNLIKYQVNGVTGERIQYEHLGKPASVLRKVQFASHGFEFPHNWILVDRSQLVTGKQTDMVFLHPDLNVSFWIGGSIVNDSSMETGQDVISALEQFCLQHDCEIKSIHKLKEPGQDVEIGAYVLAETGSGLQQREVFRCLFVLDGEFFAATATCEIGAMQRLSKEFLAVVESFYSEN